MPRKKKAETAPASPRSRSKTKGKATSEAAQKPAKEAKKSAATKPLKVQKAQKAVPRAKAGGTASVSTAPRKKPSRQGETQMVAFIRDPRCIFTYWEVTPESIESVKQQLMGEYKGSSMVLRVFKTASNGEIELIQEIRVEPGEMNRYVELKENNGNYFIEIAQKTLSGRTIVYARSNKIITGIPSAPPGDTTGQRASGWETPEGFFENFGGEDETEMTTLLPGVSSAEAHRKDLERKKLDRYSASRMN